MPTKKNIILGLNVVRNWSAYLLGRPRPIPVGYVILSTTYACNAKCMMCNIHDLYRQNPSLAKQEMDLSQMLERLRESSVIRRVRHIDLTGGEPFLKAGLRDFILGLFSMRRIDLVTITTNGMLTERILATVEPVLSCIPSEKTFSMSISLDGIGELHDSIRGVPGAFANVETTINRLRRLRERHPNLVLRSNAVIQRENVHALNALKDFWKQHDIAGAFGVIQAPFYTRSSEAAHNDVRRFSKDDITKIKLAEPKSKGMNYYLDHNFTRPLHCFAAYSALFIDPLGAVYPCNFLCGNASYLAGSVRERSIDAIWSSEALSAVRRKVKACPFTQCWNGCEVDQTLVQYEPLDRLIRAGSCGLLSYYRLRGLKDFA